jgi:Fe-S cluster assembly scaffold protein SufB
MIDLEEVKRALEKPSPYGPDIDLSRYKIDEGGIIYREPSQEITESAREKVGISVEQATYLQVGETVFARAMAEKLFKEYNVVVKPLFKALKEDKLAEKLAWTLLRPDQDKYTAYAYLYGKEAGYYVYVPPGTKVPLPIYTCLSLFTENQVQTTHNIVYLDEGSEAIITTGCLVPHGVKGGLHVGLSEFYVAEKARLIYTMIHSWGEGTHVRPRTVVRVKEGGEYVSYYSVYSPVASIQTYPMVHLEKKASAKLVSVIAGSGPGVYDIGGGAILEGEGSSAELVSRTISSKGSRIISRSSIEALTGGTKGHIECLGVMLDDRSTTETIPVLKTSVEGVELTHEAAIGMLSGEKLEYLLARGFTEEEARSILLRGYLTLEVKGIPPSIKAEIDRITDYVIKHALG